MSAPRKNVFSAAQSRARFLRLNAVEQSGGERHATWLELFFDLVFVLTMAELANLLHGNPDWTGLVSFAALFVPVWWLWIDFSYYADQLDRKSTRLNSSH